MLIIILSDYPIVSTTFKVRICHKMPRILFLPTLNCSTTGDVTVFYENSHCPCGLYSHWEITLSWKESPKETGNQTSESTHFCVTRLFFLSLLSRNFDDRLSSNFHRFVILCICLVTPSEKTGLWQLPIVFTTFKMNVNKNLLRSTACFKTVKAF